VGDAIPTGTGQVDTMDGYLTIEAFHTLLASDDEGSLLLAALRRLAAMEKAKIVIAILESDQQWTGE
jgi:hypothetical protein